MALSGVCLAEIVWHCLPLLPLKTDSRIKAKAEFSGQSLLFSRKYRLLVTGLVLNTALPMFLKMFVY